MRTVATEYGGSGDPKRSMELLWGTREAPRRGPRPRLTVEQIIGTATRIADTEGLAALSMRRVGEELGVTAMSLYTYVPSKAELVDLMIDSALGELEPVMIDGAGWRASLERAARQNWDLFRRHPWMLQTSMSRPVLGPNTLRRYDHELRAVDGVGLSDVDMDLVVTLLSNYVRGAVRTALEAAEAERRTGMSEQQWWDAYAPLLERVFDGDAYPVAARVGAAAGEEYQGAVAPERAFEFGLQRVLDGIGAYIDFRRGTPDP
jgi:AcrR family transcriptional regulator